MFDSRPRFGCRRRIKKKHRRRQSAPRSPFVDDRHASTANREGTAMHLKKTRRNGRIYLSVVQNYREGGRTRTKTIESIGYVDTLEKTYPDPIAHFQAYVESLNEQRRAQNPPIELRFAADSKIDPDHVASARWGCAIALAYLSAPRRAHFRTARVRAHHPCGVQA